MCCHSQMDGLYLPVRSSDKLVPPSGPIGEEESDLAGFLFRLETEDGAPAEPPTLSAAVPNWKPGDTIHLGKRTLRVVSLRDEDSDQAPVLVVEEAN
jgi:hypothetical protein